MEDRSEESREGLAITVKDHGDGSAYVRVMIKESGRRKGMTHHNPLQAASMLFNKLVWGGEDEEDS